MARPRPVPSPGRLRREEGLEDGRLDVGGDSLPGVRHREHGVRVRVGPGTRRAEGVVRDAESGPDGDRARPLDGVARIDHEVHQDLLDLPRVGRDHQRLPRRLVRQRDAASHEPPQHVEEPGHDLVQVEPLPLEDLAPREREQLPDEGAGAVGCLPDGLEVAAQAVHVARPGERQVHVTRDGLQDVVEVVRDAAGEPSHRLQLLRVEQSLLQGPPLGDVAGERHDHGTAEVGAGRDHHLLGEDRPVAPLSPELEAVGLSGEGARDQASDGLEVVAVRCRQLQGGTADEELLLVAVHLDGTLVHVEEHTVLVLHVDRFRRPLEQLPIAELRDAQPLLRLEPGGDVVEDHGRRGALSQPGRVQEDLDVHQPAVRTREAGGERGRRGRAREHGVQRLPERLPAVRLDDVEQRGAREILAAPTQDAPERLVHVADPLAVQDRDAVRVAFDQLTVHHAVCGFGRGRQSSHGLQGVFARTGRSGGVTPRRPTRAVGSRDGRESRGRRHPAQSGRPTRGFDPLPTVPSRASPIPRAVAPRSG